MYETEIISCQRSGPVSPIVLAIRINCTLLEKRRMRMVQSYHRRCQDTNQSRGNCDKGKQTSTELNCYIIVRILSCSHAFHLILIFLLNIGRELAWKEPILSYRSPRDFAISGDPGRLRNIQQKPHKCQNYQIYCFSSTHCADRWINTID